MNGKKYFSSQYDFEQKHSPKLYLKHLSFFINKM